MTASYSLRAAGDMRVISRGYSDEKNQWQEVEGKAYFVQSSDLGYLKVSFFGHFYGAYVIIDLDQTVISTHWSLDRTNPICGFWPDHPRWIR